MRTPAKDNLDSDKAFEREKWSDERQLREREIDLKQRELDKAVWANPFVIAFSAAIITAAASIYVSADSSRQQRELEILKAEQARILVAIKTGNPDKAAENLQFMIDVGLIVDPQMVTLLKQSLANRIPGKGPALPSWDQMWSDTTVGTGKYGDLGWTRNPNIGYVQGGCENANGSCAAKKDANTSKYQPQPGCTYSNFRSLIAKRSNIGSRGSRPFAPEIWSENVDEAVRCLSVASFGLRDVFASNLGSGLMSGSPSFGHFSWRSKKSDCPAA